MGPLEWREKVGETNEGRMRGRFIGICGGGDGCCGGGFFVLMQRRGDIGLSVLLLGLCSY